MRISSVSSFNNISYNNKNVLNKDNNVNKSSVSVPINSNSLSEAIGRSQVISFSGYNYRDGRFVIHKCDEAFSNNIDEISYDRKDGSYVRTTTTKKGVLISQEEYYPKQNLEILTEVNNKKTTKIKKFADKTITETYDEKGRQIYYKDENHDGNTHIENTEFGRNRKVIRDLNNGRQESIRVVDLRTGKDTSAREVCEHTYHDKATDTYVTYNLVTGDVYVEEKFGLNDVRLYRKEYYEGTTNLKQFIHHNDKTGGEDITNYGENSIRTSFISVSKNGREQTVYEYASDGKTVEKHIHQVFDRKDNLKQETYFIPRTDIIQSHIDYKGDETIVTTYNKKPNIPASKEYFDGDFLYRKIKYHSDGMTEAIVENYGEDGSKDVTRRTEEGRKFLYEEIDANDNVLQRIEYYTDTQKPKKITDFNIETGEHTVSHFRNKEKHPYRTVEFDKNNQRKTVTDFYLYTEVPRLRREYNPDGSYTEKNYDEFGDEVSSQDYSADGTKKNQGAEHRANIGNTRFSKNRTLSDDEVLDRITAIVTRADGHISRISDREWAAFSRIVGPVGKDAANNPKYLRKEDFIDMTSETFRPLSKKFHPDINVNNPKVEQYSKIFVILNVLYKRNK
ncbi:hypothetical protein IJ182_09570 [bacterium]|nr:hypothetical protein [bacterium]